MAIKKVISFNCTPAQLWEIVGTPDRVDWVPGVTDCVFDGEVRSLKLPGAGHIREKILSHSNAKMTMQYSCIESPAPLEEHLASIKIQGTAEGCQMQWETAVKPTAFEPFIATSMDGAIAQIHKILGAD